LGGWRQGRLAVAVAAASAAGELWAAGPTVAMGYRANAEATGLSL